MSPQNEPIKRRGTNPARIVNLAGAPKLRRMPRQPAQQVPKEAHERAFAIQRALAEKAGGMHAHERMALNHFVSNILAAGSKAGTKRLLTVLDNLRMRPETREILRKWAENYYSK